MKHTDLLYSFFSVLFISLITIPLMTANESPVLSPPITAITHTTMQVSGGFLDLGTQNIPAIDVTFTNGQSQLIAIQQDPWIVAAKPGDRLQEQPGFFNPSQWSAPSGLVQPPTSSTTHHHARR